MKETQEMHDIFNVLFFSYIDLYDLPDKQLLYSQTSAVILRTELNMKFYETDLFLTVGNNILFSWNHTLVAENFRFLFRYRYIIPNT